MNRRDVFRFLMHSWHWGVGSMELWSVELAIGSSPFCGAYLRAASLDYIFSAQLRVLFKRWKEGDYKTTRHQYNGTTRQGCQNTRNREESRSGTLDCPTDIVLANKKIWIMSGEQGEHLSTCSVRGCSIYSNRVVSECKIICFIRKHVVLGKGQNRD